MVFVEEVAALVTASKAAAVVLQTVWSMVEAAVVVVDRPVIAGLPVLEELLVAMPLVYLRVVLPQVDLRQLVALQPVAFPLLGLLELKVLRSAALEPPQVVELCQSPLAVLNYHRELLDVVEVWEQTLLLPVFQLRLSTEASAPPGGQGEVLPDLFQRLHFVSLSMCWLQRWLDARVQCVLEPQRLMPVPKNPSPRLVRPRFPGTSRMDPELQLQKISGSCSFPELRVVFVAFA